MVTGATHPRLIAVVQLAAVPVALWAVLNTGIVWGIDAYAYWAPDPIGRYPADAGLEGIGEFRYAPPLAVVANIFGALPWPVFIALWTALLVGVLAWMVGPRWIAVAIAVPFVARELAFGNIHLLMAAAVVAPFPVLWVLPILAKVTPAVLLTWFVARREWSALAWVAAALVALAVVAELLLPGSWAAWVTMLRTAAGGGDPTLVPRVLAGGVLAFLAGRLDARWLLPVALLLALPHLGWSSLSVLVAVPAALRWRASGHAEPAPGSPRTARLEADVVDRVGQRVGG